MSRWRSQYVGRRCGEHTENGAGSVTGRIRWRAACAVSVLAAAAFLFGKIRDDPFIILVYSRGALEGGQAGERMLFPDIDAPILPALPDETLLGGEFARRNIQRESPYEQMDSYEPKTPT